MKQSVSETLERSRQVSEQYKKFLQQKQESDKAWKLTEQKLDKTLAKISDTKDSLRKVDEMYEKYQKSFDDLLTSAVEQLQGSNLLEIPNPQFKPNRITTQEFCESIKRQKKIMILTGAGISAASGIPTFRGDDGYWTKKKEEKVDPEQFLTFKNYTHNQFDVWSWLDSFYSLKEKSKLNEGHSSLDAIAQYLHSNGKSICIVTQNIDNFHRQAQTKNTYPIYEIHGNIMKVRCDNCSSQQAKFYPYEQFREILLKEQSSPSCPKCNKKIRPHIMFFDEFYSQKFNQSQSVKEFLSNNTKQKVQNGQNKGQNQDIMLIVIGTALQTGLSRSIVEKFIGKKQNIIQINKQCIIKQGNITWMEGKSDEILQQISRNLKKNCFEVKPEKRIEKTVMRQKNPIKQNKSIQKKVIQTSSKKKNKP